MNKTEIEKTVVEILQRHDSQILKPADDRTNNKKEGNILVYLDKNGRDELAHLQNITDGASDEFVNFINPHLPIRTFTIHTKSKYQYVVDNEKVIKKIETGLYFEKKRIVENSEKLIKDENFDDDIAKEIRQEAQKNIRIAEVHCELLLRHKDNLDMRIISTKTKKAYNEIRCFYHPANEDEKSIEESKKRKDHHISIEKPTAIWYEPQEKKSDETATRFVKSSIDANFANIYYKPLEDSNLSIGDIMQEFNEMMRNGEVE